jgi:hypothetical protein
MPRDSLDTARGPRDHHRSDMAAPMITRHDAPAGAVVCASPLALGLLLGLRVALGLVALGLTRSGGPVV